MEMMLIALVCLVLVVSLVSLVAVLKKKSSDMPLSDDLLFKFQVLGSDLQRVENVVKMEIAANRKESNEAARDGREEVSKAVYSFSGLISASIQAASSQQKDQLELFANNLKELKQGMETRISELTSSIDAKLNNFAETSTTNSKDTRQELKSALEAFQIAFSKQIETFTAAQRNSFFDLQGKQSEQNKTTSEKLEQMRIMLDLKFTALQSGNEEKLEQMRGTLETKIVAMQTGNEKKLEEMRATVDEKLQKTLESRLGESFKLVSERLEAVHKGLGDMQQLATGVGDLKKVLTNVKTRGVFGEFQLENILEQLLTPEQYAKNVKTKEGSNDMVEFAIKLPGKEDKDQQVWLPIDCKFPKEDFELLMDAYDKGSLELIEGHKKNFIKGIRKCAADISGKYIDPPHTTDFAIMFLPFESLYAEVLRMPGLFESIQRECKVTITGPTTISALLNSLQMGFRTLAIQKRSSEVWEVLGAVKTEFGKFANVLDAAYSKLETASKGIDAARIRTRAIERKLRVVQELPAAPAMELVKDSFDVVPEEGPGA